MSSSSALPLPLLMLGLSLLVACGGGGPTDCRLSSPRPGEMTTCRVPGWDDRPFDLFLPTGTDAPLSVVLSLHGGGGSRDGGNRASCEGGDREHASCFASVGAREGFALVAPDGTNGGLDLRTWNAGGGGDWQCISGAACEQDVDDVAYFHDLLDELEGIIPVDEDRVYATGLSNGGAMAYRLACEMAERIAAIAPMGAGSQVVAVQGCEPSRAVPVIHFHGVEDPAWPYEGGDKANAKGVVARFMSVEESIEGTDEIEGWVERNGCEPEGATVDVEDAFDDGMRTTETAYIGCNGGAEVRRVVTQGGGHTIPGGWQYLGERTIGGTTLDFTGSERAWAFLERFALSDG